MRRPAGSSLALLLTGAMILSVIGGSAEAKSVIGGGRLGETGVIVN